MQKNLKPEHKTEVLYSVLSWWFSSRQCHGSELFLQFSHAPFCGKDIGQIKLKFENAFTRDCVAIFAFYKTTIYRQLQFVAGHITEESFL